MSMFPNRLRASAKLSIGIFVLALAACGGGGGDGVNFNPAPPENPEPPPPPSTPSTVTIFSSPEPGDYTSVGVWTNLGDPDHYDTHMITSVVLEGTNQPQIRYTDAGSYEVQLPGEAYGELLHDPNLIDPDRDNNFFVIDNGWSRGFVIRRARDDGYLYSELATWVRPDLDFGFTTDIGVVAVGSATPAGAVPVTGSATFDGILSGLTDAKYVHEGGYTSSRDAGGTVTLDFDFGAGTLDGNILLMVTGDGMNPDTIGTYDFTQTVFASGSTAYSGAFETSLPGFNFFNGLFTGPNAEETIGNWAVPFTYGGNTHQAIGAWIARRGD